MKKILRVLVIAVFGMFILGGSAMAAEMSVQDVLNSITLSPVAGVSSVNAVTDKIADGQDSTWSITAAGGSVATMIIELAGNANVNTFGIYDPTNPTKQVTLFNGPAGAGAQVMLSIKADGSIFVNNSDTGTNFAYNAFGYFLGTPGNTFYSDTNLNGDKYDHMWAYQGKDIDTVQLPGLAQGLWTSNEYILAFEDTSAAGTDGDHNDMMLMVESVKPVPEPASLLLLGLGIVSLAGFRRKMK